MLSGVVIKLSDNQSLLRSFFLYSAQNETSLRILQQLQLIKITALHGAHKKVTKGTKQKLIKLHQMKLLPAGKEQK